MTASRKKHCQPVPSFEFGGRAFKPKEMLVKKRMSKPKTVVQFKREIVTDVLDNGEHVGIRYGYED